MPDRSVVRRTRTLLALAVVISGCAGSTEESADPTGTTTETVVAAPSDAPETSPATSAPAPTSTAIAASTTNSAPVPSAVAQPDPGGDCRRIEDFGSDATDRWFVVDDGVMGGRSLGNAAVVEDALRFSGMIETEGGGFSSLRALVPEGALAGATELRFRARSDGRAYEVIVDDGVEGRDPRVSHFGAIPLSGAGEWQTVSVRFADLEARLFGTPVNDVAFVPELASSIGVILADGTDGAFQLDLDWVEACR